MDWFGLDRGELRLWAGERGLPPYRGDQVFAALHQRQARSFTEISVLPRALRDELDTTSPLTPVAEVTRQESSDGTAKSLLGLADGRRIECVSIPTSDRHTVCISTQVGCAVGCSFCASGIEGVVRDLEAGEIVGQVLHHQRQRPVTNVVFMGSGEPLFNYPRVIQAIRLLGDGLGLGRRRITVSTSGVPERIVQLGRDEPQVTLALSLHAPDDETRSRLVPLNRRWPIRVLLDALDRYSQAVNRRMTFEYVLLADANMADHHAEALGRLARSYGAHINLIPFNPVSATPHRQPSPAAIERFAGIVANHGGHATVRGQRGADIDAACGQLARRDAADG